MTSLRFLDANVFLRYFLEDDPVRTAFAFELLERIDRGEELGATSSFVIFEVIFTLQRTLKVPKYRIRELLMLVLNLRHLRLPERELVIRSLDLYVEKNISFADAYIAVSMLTQGINEIYSWDADYDRIFGIRRIEPGATG